MKIVFMGSPQFSIPSLLKLYTYNYKIVGVYTRKTHSSHNTFNKYNTTIHTIANNLSLKLLTPERLKSYDNIKEFQSLNADIGIVVAYGLLIPKEFLEIPKYGFVNIHPSDLPKWRGAAPIQRSIIAGDQNTAVCIIKINTKLDAGDILLHKKISLDRNSNAKNLHDKCSELGGAMMTKTLQLYKKNNIQAKKQNNDNIIYAKKIVQEEALLNFDLPAFAVNNKIRAFSPKPGAYFIYQGILIKIISATYKKSNKKYIPGTVIDNNLSIACNTGILLPILLKRSGRQTLNTSSFLKGFNITKGSKLNK